MKGLFLKDFYMILKYYRGFFVLAVVFLVISYFDNGNIAFLFYPCVVASTLPGTLYSYDEKEKWCVYCQTFPISRRQYVSEKYLLGALGIAAMLVVTAVIQALSMAVKGAAFNFGGWLSMIIYFFAVSLMIPSVILPFFFKYGAEKGRLIYIMVIIMVCSFLGFCTVHLRGDFFEIPFLGRMISVFQTEVLAGRLFSLAIPVMLYALSWLLSLSFYERREL